LPVVPAVALLINVKTTKNNVTASKRRFVDNLNVIGSKRPVAGHHRRPRFAPVKRPPGRGVATSRCFTLGRDTGSLVALHDESGFGGVDMHLVARRERAAVIRLDGIYFAPKTDAIRQIMPFELAVHDPRR
jgi:hypothetical protein